MADVFEGMSTMARASEAAALGDVESEAETAALGDVEVVPPVAAAGVETPVAAAGVETAAAGVETPVAAAGVEQPRITGTAKLTFPANCVQMLRDIDKNTQYTAWMSEVEQKVFEKLAIIERRLMNGQIEVHESIRQIQMAVDVYKHEVTDVSWFIL